MCYDMNLSIFRKYDIRALAEEELTDEFVNRIGWAFGSFIKKRNMSQLVLGRDNRLSSGRITNSLIDGVLASGCGVYNIGEVTTPIMCFSIKHLNVNAGVMVTGSHNPPQYNGIKFQVGRSPLCGNDLQEIIHILGSNNYNQQSGQLSTKNIIPEYINLIKERIHLRRSIKAVIDCGNSNLGAIAPKLLKDIGCDVVPLYCDPDGSFPNHQPDPANPDNLIDLVRTVQQTKADIGIAFDGDGNRIGIVDEMGNIISPDIIIALLARDLLKNEKNGKVVCDVKCSQALVEDVSNHGGKVIMSRTGYPFILEKMFKEKAVIAGELTGHICINNNPFVFGDALFVSCRILENLSNNTKSFSEHLSDYPKYYSTPELRIPCPDERKFQVIEDIISIYADGYQYLKIDGIKIFFDDQSWALIRASNTEPCLSVRIESKSEKGLKSLKSEIATLLYQNAVIDKKTLLKLQ